MYTILCTLLVALGLVAADFRILSDKAITRSFIDVHTAYAEGYYIVVYVDGLDNAPGSETFYRYYVGVYQLVNGTQLVKPMPDSGDYSIRSKNIGLRVTTKDNSDSANVVTELLLCSASECAEFRIGNNFVTFLPTEPWCHDEILENDKLLSLKYEQGYTLAVVARGTDLYSFLCFPNPLVEGTAQLICADNLGPTTQFHSVESTISGEKINIFVLLSNGPVTALCSFSLSIGSLDGQTITLQHSSLVVIDNSPTSLAVSSAAEGHVAFVSSAKGVISKVRASKIIPAYIKPFYVLRYLCVTHFLLAPCGVIYSLSVQSYCTMDSSSLSAVSPRFL